MNSGFHGAAGAVLDHLRQRLPFDLWMVTRTDGDDWIVLAAADQGYGIQAGDVFRWADSFCSRMVQGLGPRVAPCAEDVPAYACAPFGRQVPIGAYAGAPMYGDDGQLLGTLCAIHPTPLPESIEQEADLIELLARLLSKLLRAETKVTAAVRATEQAKADAVTDPLTGLLNRRGWDERLRLEQARCERASRDACLISLDLDYLKQVNDTAGHTAGDELIQRAASAIQHTIRRSDLAARLGGDEFAILGLECNLPGARALVDRLETAFAEQGVRATWGLALWRPGRDLAEVWREADQQLCERKRARPKLLASPLRKAPCALGN